MWIEYGFTLPDWNQRKSAWKEFLRSLLKLIYAETMTKTSFSGGLCHFYEHTHNVDAVHADGNRIIVLITDQTEVLNDPVGSITPVAGLKVNWVDVVSVDEALCAPAPL